jgi:hypothetical protein
MATSKIDTAFCFFNKESGLIETSTNPVDRKNCMHDSRLIAMDGAKVLTLREFAALNAKANPGVSQEKYEDLLKLKDVEISKQAELIKELQSPKSASETDITPKVEVPKRGRGRPPKKDASKEFFDKGK